MTPQSPTPARPSRLAGDLPAFLSDKLGFLLHSADQQGDVVSLNLGGPTLLLRDPEDIRHVLESNAFNYEKTPRLTSRRGRWLSGSGLLTSSMRASVNHRRVLQPIYASTTITAFADTIATATETRLSRWPTAGTLDMAAEMMDLAQQIMGLLLCGVDFSSPEGATLGRAVGTRRRFLHNVFDSLLPLAEFLPTPERFAYALAERRLHRGLAMAINQRRSAPEEFQDVLALLMQARTAEGHTLGDKELVDEALTFALPGYETIGEALTWTLHLLSINPVVANAVHWELDTVAAGQDPGVADIRHLDLLQRVIAESLRLYPPTWIYIRMVTQNDRLPGGTEVQSGTKLYLCPWVSHRNPRWFANPEQFDPECFTAEAIQSRPRYAYFPFGGGQRVCIGRALAQMELPMILARILRRYKLEPLHNQTVQPSPHITLTPRGGLKVGIQVRSLSKDADKDAGVA